MSLFELYVLFVLVPALGSLGSIVTTVSLMLLGVGCFITLIVSAEGEFEDTIPYWKKSVKYLGIPLVVGALLLLAPDEKQVKFLAGGYVVTNVEGIAELPENIVESANTFLKSIADEQENN